jgi:hypothetical protein
MRAFVNAVTPDIEAACAAREDMRKDADSYRRRYAKAQKDMQGAQTPEKRQVAQQEMAKLTVKLDRATKLFEDQNALVKSELEKAKIARDQAIEMMVVTVAACQMELFEQSYKRLVGATASFPSDKMNQVRKSVQDCIRAGGPNPSEINSGTDFVSKATNLATGKATMSDYRQEDANRQQQEADALDRARQMAMADEQARTNNAMGGVQRMGMGGGPPIPPKRGGGNPPAPPARGGAPAPPIPARAAPSFGGGGAGGPPAPPSRGGAAPAIPARAPAPMIPTRAAAPAIPTRSVPPPAPNKFGGGGAVVPPPMMGGGARPPMLGGGGAGGGGGGGSFKAKAGPPAPPVKKGAPPAPPSRASAKPTATALYDNVPDDADELAFSAGDKIEILKEDASGWWEGKHVKSGKSGIFPSNFVNKD